MKASSLAWMLSALSLLATSQVQASDKVAFTFQDLGTLGGKKSSATGINANGQIVGHSEVLVPGASAPSVHAVIWNAGNATDLGPGQALAINAAGHVVGASVDASGNEFATLWINKTPSRLGAGAAHAINASDHIAGELAGADGVRRPAVWRNNTPSLLSDLPGRATGINLGGQIVGYTTNSANVKAAIRWVGDVPISLGADAIPYAINDANLVVGTGQIGLGVYGVFFWNASNAGTWYGKGISGPIPGNAYAIGNQGWVVGDAFGEGVLLNFATGKPEYLSAIGVPGNPTIVNQPADITYMHPLGVNDKGQIVGTACYRIPEGGTFADQSCRAFLLTPTAPTPCEVKAVISNVSNWAYTVQVTLQNDTTAPLTGWQVNLTLKDKTFAYKVQNAKVKLTSGVNATALPLATNQTIPGNQAGTMFSFSAAKLPSSIPTITGLTATLGGQSCLPK